MFALSAVSFIWVTPVGADGLAGSYLTGRKALSQSDFTAASNYLARALARDNKNLELMESVILAYVGQGDIQRALVVARRLNDADPAHQIANMLLLADNVRDQDYEAALAQLAKGEAVSALVDGLATAWIQVGQGNMANALVAFDKIASGDGTESFGLYHKALSLALAGDLEGADDILAGRSGVPIPATRRGTIARAEILSRLERNADAVALIDETLGEDLDPSLAVMRARLVGDEMLTLSSIRSASDGLAEVFFSVAGALSGEAQDGYTLVYSRVAEYLRGDHVEAILMTAQLLENMGRYALATDAYDRIPRDDPAFFAAEIGRADGLRLSGNVDAAIEVLRQLAESHADQPNVFSALGDILRQESQFDEATKAYDRAIALYETPELAQWGLFFTRGITHERLDRWDLAEADFRTALALNPDQPQVLNYLGYSYVELQTNLGEALSLIERAVAARPQDGYIRDSLGWVLYRLGRYPEAAEHMEHAAELMPVDPIINDHLGDAYWAVGRKREANFQWNRALSFEPEEDDADRIRRKLDVGLDLVLEEEGAEPIALANDG